MRGWFCLLLLWSYLEEPGTVRWVEGRELAARLELAISATWSGRPLREALRSLSELHRVSVLLDRRVDPDQPLELVVSDLALGEALERLAASVECGYAQFGPVAYIGPPQVAARLRTLSALLEEAVRGLPASLRERASQRARLDWPNLATPRGLLERLSSEAGIELAGLDQVPHDLWAAADLAPLTWMDRVLLVTAQFDLWPQPADSADTLVLRPIPQQVLLERSYPGGSNPRALAQRWQQLAPHCQIEVRGRRVVVRGLLEDHERLRAGPAPAPRKPRPAAAGQTRIKRWKVQGRLDDVLASLAASYGLELHVDRAALAAAGTPADTLVVLEVEQATLDEALHRLLDPLQLGFRIEDASLYVFPAGDK